MRILPTVRAQLSPDLQSSLDELEARWELLAELRRHPFTWDPPESSAELFDHYLRALYAVYVNKLFALTDALIYALNTENFLLYGSIARASLEYTAVLRYYVLQKTLPLLNTTDADGNLTPETQQTLLEFLDQHLRGGRYDWQPFLFEELHLKGSKLPPPPTQVNILTCLKKWMKQDSTIEPQYALYCDLVHPNLGSSLLVTRLQDEHVQIGGQGGTALGWHIFSRTFPQLWQALQEIPSCLAQLRELQGRLQPGQPTGQTDS
ncbi:MAG: hypothetical protein AAGG02_19550 [Cyanobacteria bacterium P01_H01_bin.15]